MSSGDTGSMCSSAALASVLVRNPPAERHRAARLAAGRVALVLALIPGRAAFKGDGLVLQRFHGFPDIP